jgi:hypothetical protein
MVITQYGTNNQTNKEKNKANKKFREELIAYFPFTAYLVLDMTQNA